MASRDTRRPRAAALLVVALAMGALAGRLDAGGPWRFLAGLLGLMAAMGALFLFLQAGSLEDWEEAEGRTFGEATAPERRSRTRAGARAVAPGFPNSEADHATRERQG